MSNLNQDALQAMSDLYVKSLQMYAFSGDVACLLVPQRQLLGIQNNDGETPLMIAISNENQVAANSFAFITNDEEINTQNKQGTTSLMLSVTKNNIEITSKLLQKNNINLSINDNKGNNAFHLAVSGELSQMLCEKAEQQQQPQLVNSYNVEGLTPFLKAVTQGNYEKVQTLIQHCDVTSVNLSNNGNLFHESVKRNDLKMVHLLVNYFHSTYNNPEILMKLINHCDSFGNTPLHHAVQCNFFHLIPSLLQNGADISIMNANGMTPYDIGKELYNVEAINSIFETLGLPSNYNNNTLQQQAPQKLNIEVPTIQIQTHSSQQQPEQKQVKQSKQVKKSVTPNPKPPQYKDIKKYSSLPTYPPTSNNDNKMDTDDDGEWQMLSGDVSGDQSIDGWKLQDSRKNFKLKMFNNNNNTHEKKKDKNSTKSKKNNEKSDGDNKKITSIFKNNFSLPEKNETKLDAGNNNHKKRSSGNFTNKMSELRHLEDETTHGKVLKKIAAVDDDLSTLD
eukprot:Pgem_evm1s15306